MPTRCRSRLRHALVMMYLGLLGSLGGSTSAAIETAPDTTGAFHACVNKRTGKLRIVDSAVSCQAQKKGKRGATEFPISWSQNSQPGPQGAPGPKGDAGPAGPRPFFAYAASDATLSCPSWCYVQDSPGGPILGLASPPSSNAYSNRWASTGFLTLSQPSTVLVHASISYTSPNGAGGKDANCYLVDENTASVGHQSVYLRVGGDFDLSASFTEVATLPAGTHDIQIWCYSYGTPAIAITAAGLTVLAVGN